MFATNLGVTLLAAAMLPAAGPTLDGLRFGASLVGKVPEKDQLAGKVVLVERWGVH